MVRDRVIRQCVATVDALPDWSCLAWVRMKFLSPTISLGEAATTVSVEQLNDFTPQGAQFGKTVLRSFVAAGGRIGSMGNVRKHVSYVKLSYVNATATHLSSCLQ